MRQFKVTVFRSLKYFSAQMVDLKTGATLYGVTNKQKESLMSLADLAKKFTDETKKQKATKCFLAKKYAYAGKVKTFIDACRKEGLEL